MKFNQSERKLVAREAARLLYFGLAKEYLSAKIKAANELKIKILPSNREIAEELDRLASMLEGPQREINLVKLRREALEIMKTLTPFNSKLIGSVWRGTATKYSDIDIIVYCNNVNKILEKLKKSGYEIEHTEKTEKNVAGERQFFFHIYIKLPSGHKAEIVVRKEEEIYVKETCSIYGDEITGLTADELERLLKVDPLRRFIPD